MFASQYDLATFQVRNIPDLTSGHHIEQANLESKQCL